MIKKILLILGTIIVLFAGVNAVSAVSPTVRDTINGLPVADQINFLADEIDKIKKEQACQKADIIKQQALEASGIGDYETSHDLSIRREQMISHGLAYKLEKFDSLHSQYLEAMRDCQR